MKKQSKRLKKFQSTGGIKARIEKGTITKHGKLRKRKKDTSTNVIDEKIKLKKQQQHQITKDNEKNNQNKLDDFLGNDNLSGLDIDSFFNKLANDVENNKFIDNEEDEEEEDDNVIVKKDSKKKVNAKNDKKKNTKKIEKDEDSSNNSMNDEEKDAEDNSDDDNDEDDDDDDEEEDNNSNSEDDDDNSDDEDLDAAEARMKKQLSKMSKSDPDFHKFLKDNEQSLLEFGDDEEHDNEGDKEEEDNDMNDNDAKDENEKIKIKNNDIQLTLPVLKELSKNAFELHNIKGLKKIISAYKSACYLSDSSNENANEETKSNKGNNNNNEKKYIIDSSKIFDELMVLCLNKCHEEFYYHLLGNDNENIEEDDKMDEDEEKTNNNKDTNNKEEIKIITNKSEYETPLNPKKLEKSIKWQQIKPILITFFNSTLHLLTEAKDNELLTFVLKALSKSIRLLTPLSSSTSRITENYLKLLINMWSAPLDSNEDYQIVRLQSFFRIRQLALTQPFPFIEDILKKTYLAYAKRTKFASSSSSGILSSSLPTITFMGNCLVELYSLDYHSSYQHAFVYIRQLALLLRTAIQKKTVESLQQIYCWQYFHCIKLWVAILSSASLVDDGIHMKSLIYPLTEIILGTAKFLPSPIRYMPCRLHCIRLLQQLASASETFIPTTSLILDCFDWKEWYLTPKKNINAMKSIRNLQFLYILKLPGKNDYLRTHEQLEAGIKELFIVLQREIELYKYSAGFPEFSLRIQTRLKQFNKITKNSRWRTYTKGCLELIDKYSKDACTLRSKLNDAPKDVKRLECLLPIGGKNMYTRHEESIISEQKILDANRPPPEKKSTTTNKDGKKKKRFNDDDDDDSDDHDEKMNDADSDDDDSEKEKVIKKQPKKKKKKIEKKPVDLEEMKKHMLPDDVLKNTNDQVKDGIDWSDDE